MPKKEFNYTPDGAPIKENNVEDTERCVMVPLPRDAENTKGMWFVTREQAIDMAITLLLSSR